MSRSDGRSRRVSVASASGSGLPPPGAPSRASPSWRARPTVAQISTETATCATPAQGRSRVHTLAAPDQDLARRTGRGRWSRVGPGRSAGDAGAGADRASRARAAARRRRAPGAGTSRSRAPPRVGTSRPSINGQSVNTSCASLARTYVPTRSRTPMTAAVDEREPRERSRGRASWRPRWRSASRRRSREVTSAISRRAVTKCAVTHQGSSSVATTTAPIPAWAITSGNARTAGHRRRGSRTPPGYATRPVSAASTATRNAIARCENSIREWTVPDGNRCPGSQAGHVEHPRPEPGPADEPADREQHDRGDRRGEREGAEAGAGEEHRDDGMIAPPREAPGLAILRLVTGELRARVDAVLAAFLDERSRRRAARPGGAAPVDEIARLVAAGGSGSARRSATGASARPAARTRAVATSRSCAPRPRSSSCTRWRSSTTT